MKWRRAKHWSVASVLMVGASTAHVNIGLPPIAVFMPPLWVALAPIIVIETAIVSWRGFYPFCRTLGAVALANFISTVIGVPIFWFLLATTELVCCGTSIGLESPLAKLYAVTV